MWEAIETYLNRRQPLIIVAGADYGQGSSRDWAAKGVRLAGVETVVAEGFERIHRTNLLGMGVLPLEFKPGTTRLTLVLDGTETFDVAGEPAPGADLTLVVHRRSGETLQVPVTCRLDTAEEVSIYEAGGVLQRFAQDFLAANKSPPEDNHPPHRMASAPQIKIPAVYMRGGTSKGVFFRLQDLPAAARQPGRRARHAAAARHRQPRSLRQADRWHGRRDLSHQQGRDPVARSTRPDHDVDYLFGQVSIDSAFVDWSGNCGNLSAAVGPFAIAQRPGRSRRAFRENGTCTVRIWQANIGKTIVAHVPITNGEVQETGDFELDGVTFPAAEVSAGVHRPGRRGRRTAAARCSRPASWSTTWTCRASARLQGHDDQCRHPDHLRQRREPSATPAPNCRTRSTATPRRWRMFETIRAHGAVTHGPDQGRRRSARRQHTPKVAFVAPPTDYTASSGKAVAAARYRPAGARAVDGQAAPRHDGHSGRGHRHRRGRFPARW